IELKQEKNILSNLNTEFNENLKDLDSINSELITAIDALEVVFQTFQSDTIKYSSKELDSILSLSLSSPSWKPSEFVLNDLKNSGGLSKLSSNELKKLLFRWSRFFNELQETMTQVEKTNTELIHFVKENGSLRNLDVSDENFIYPRSKLHIDNINLLRNFKLENYIDDKLYILQEAKVSYNDAKELIMKILQATSVK
ncbi:MAG: hypothetical protein KAJ28_11425, partial [Flavobacteriaceae bacterium]|nr:hypothetical protein [Flavobacteriaceae bacterium]